MFELAGRSAVVTGGASGIGAATALAFARQGARVAIGWYPGDPYDVQLVLDQLRAAGTEGMAFELDVRNSSAVEDLVAAAAAEFGSIDICVANAGIARRTAFSRITDEDWLSLLDVNLGGTWRLFRAALPHMASGGYGRMLATASLCGTLQAWPDHAHYASSKAAIAGLVQTLAVELGPQGITVNAVAPGTVVTAQSLDPVNSLGAGGIEDEARLVPVRRAGRPEDVANAFAYLASPEASFVNGHVLVLDGGLSLTAGL